jgi:DnaD/phage-associated family protein
VNHCVTRAEKRYGLGRRPTMRQIEKEAYYWARLGVFTQEAAAEYLKKCAERDEQIQHYMYALGLGNRRAVETEERYIRSWIDMGFTVDAVALAYDKTVIYKKELNWRYLNGILRRWHEKGWHTAEEINRGDAQPKKAKNPADDGMDKYLDW